MKRVFFLLLALTVLLCGCADQLNENVGTTAAENAAQSTAEITSLPNENTAESSSAPDSGKTDIEIPLLDGETLLGATTVTVPGAIAGVSSVQLTVAMLSHGTFPNDRLFYVDARNEAGEILCFRRFPGYGFVVKSDMELNIFTVKGVDLSEKSISGNYVQFTVSDLNADGSSREKPNFLYAKTKNLKISYINLPDQNFQAFVDASADALSQQKNLSYVAEMRKDGTYSLFDTVVPFTEENIRAVQNLRAADFADCFE